MSRSSLYHSASPESLPTRLPGVNALLAGVTLNDAEHCSICEHANCLECTATPAISSTTDHTVLRPCVFPDRPAPFKNKKDSDSIRWRAGTFSPTSSPATPLLKAHVTWPEAFDRSRSCVDSLSPASSLLSLSSSSGSGGSGSSAPSTPATPRSPLHPLSSTLSPADGCGNRNTYGRASESPNASDGSDGAPVSASLARREATAATNTNSGNPPNSDGAATGLFAVFRPSGTSLAVAASGQTLSAMQEDWKSRLPGDTAPTADEIRRKPLSCPYCRRRFDRPSIRRTHINSHTGERPYECSVSGCNRRFSVLSNKYRHERSHKGQNQSTNRSDCDDE